MEPEGSDTIDIEREPTGALAELTRDLYDRRRFLKLAGGASAVGALGILAAACGSDSSKGVSTGTTSTATGTTASTGGTMSSTTSTGAASGSSGGDLAIVNYALTLEYLEADFYRAVIASGLFSGAELATIKVIGSHEQAHVQALLATAKKLGTPATRPKTKFPISDRMSVLKLAATVENLGAAAYLGQAGKIQDKGILAAALAIHSVEARHASALNTLIGQDFTPDGAFAKPASMDEVLPKVKPFIVG